MRNNTCYIFGPVTSTLYFQVLSHEYIMASGLIFLVWSTYLVVTLLSSLQSINCMHKLLVQRVLQQLQTSSCRLSYNSMSAIKIRPEFRGNIRIARFGRRVVCCKFWCWRAEEYQFIFYRGAHFLLKKTSTVSFILLLSFSNLLSWV